MTSEYFENICGWVNLGWFPTDKTNQVPPLKGVSL